MGCISYGVVLLRPFDVPCTHILAHHLLYVVGRCSVTICAVESYHVGMPVPARRLLVDEDGCVARHLHHVAVVLHATHEDSFSESGIEVAEATTVAGHGILTHIHFPCVACIAVIAVVLIDEPLRRHVVVLINEIHGPLESPCDAVAIADELDIRISFGYGFLELSVAVVVWTEPVVLIAYLKKSEVERSRMSVLDSHLPPIGVFVAIAILDGVECLLDIWLHIRVLPVMPHTHVYHEHRFSSEVLGQLQVFHHTQSVGHGVEPVGIEVSGALLDGASALLPFESVGHSHGSLAFHHTSARETEELGVQCFQHLGQVFSATVLTVLVCGREERHHVVVDGARLRAKQGKPSVAVVACCSDFGRHFLPLAVWRELFVGNGHRTEVIARLILQDSLDVTFISLTTRASPEVQFIGLSFHNLDAPPTFVPDASASVVHRHSNASRVDVVEGSTGGHCLSGIAVSPPEIGVVGIVLERSVVDQFGIESTIASMVDFLEEDAIHSATDFRSFLHVVEVHSHLGLDTK